jgi:hypothetical protein
MSARAVDEPDSPIEVFLDELLMSARALPPRRARELIAEAEAHLHDDAEAAERGGMSRHEAEAHAVTRFGPASSISAAEQSQRATPLGALARQVVLSGVRLGAVGAIAVGASGMLAFLIRAVGGTRVLVGAPSAHVMSASNCARWLAATPGATTCSAAAADDWATETIAYRLALGVLGLLAVAVVTWSVRHRRYRYGAPLLPMVSDTVALTAFGAAGIWTLGMGVDAIVQNSADGSGQWLSAAPIALAAATFYAVRLPGGVRRASMD